ncbi:SAF domain-containing protein [Knoellia sp. LjRoot47]|uniref:SAF domain-containing protein n=1 Tax=Knoellia sp. LjRoot47 TaxID=3342330 RepID=UPI003ECD3AAC
MPHLRLPVLRRPRVLGPSRRARWRRRTLRRALAGLCAAAAALLLVGLVRPPPPATTSVVVASRGLDGGTVLSARDLQAAEITGEDAPVAAVPVDGVGLLVGRRLTSRMEAGEVVTTTRLVPRSSVDGAPPGTVAAHLLVADAHALDLVSAGRRVTVYPDTGGAAVARDVLVLGVDTPGKASFTGSLPGADDGRRGLVVALEPADLERIFAGQRPDGGAPTVLAVVTA